MSQNQGLKIDGGWKSGLASLVIIMMFVVLPISINETVGFDAIAESLTLPDEEVNPYYRDPSLGGEVAGIFTNEEINARSAARYINIPLVNFQIEITKQNLLIFSVSSISVIIFLLLYSILSLVDNKNNKKELLPQNIIIN